MAFPTRQQVKWRFSALLDDPAAKVFTDTPGPGGAPSLFQNAFGEAYDVLFSAFLNQQVSQVENVIQGIIVPINTLSMTPAEMGISDFADWEWISERTAGSNDKFLDLWDEDRLTQRAQTDRLIETVWQNGAFQFVGATTVRELQLKYVSSGQAPIADNTTIGIDNSLTFLSNYSAGTVAGNKGRDDIAARCMGVAVGPKFNLGTIGGELFRLIQPLVRNRQNVVVAHKPYTSQRRILGRWRGVPYVAAQQGSTGGGAQNVPVQYSSATGNLIGAIDGVNLVFWVPVGITSGQLYRNGDLMTENVDFTRMNNQFTFVPPQIPQPGDTITVEAYLAYQV